ncbi:hypothetical protein CDD83_10927 [Cordyceps sp. RAO-2017]|nr:hypothetical protein CDD83_10927 [Cordyceps sp. RAO-2017]
MTLPSQGPAATNGPGQGIPGIPAQNYPSPGSGNPAQGNPAQGIPAQNNPAGGSPAQGNPAQGNPAPGNPAQGNPAGQTQPSVMTKTVQPSGSQPQGPLAYSQPPQQTITVITQVAAPPAGSPAPGTVGAAPVPAKPDQTKPAGPSQPVQSPSRPKDDSTAASKTKGGRPSQAPKTVTVTPLPNAQSTTPATLPPQMQSPGTNGDPSHTMTQTIGGGGGDNIEIIIINIFTGETSCRKKHSGKPCQARRPRPGTVSASPCPSGMNSTRIATVFNTIMATVGPDTPSRNSTSAATAAPQTTSRSAKGRKPRAPLTSRSL